MSRAANKIKVEEAGSDRRGSHPPGNKTSEDRLNKERLYDGVRTISHNKKNILLDVLRFIPPIHHKYFLSLKESPEEHREDELGHLEEDDAE
ncbi:hypothetical protein PR048_012420 [Dryococelus australis]|uniref:Uncharacterized protein n=1 Tax=Dryococelus australis TaxID=614101 RepID=A0ABQ9HPI2_9NEOP|nr:hypothetical protein PR048_012420 [Dryococelus australis]